MSSVTTKRIEWRFGDRTESVDAWVRHSDQLHMIVCFRLPDASDNRWHSIMTVTGSWLRRQAGETKLGGVWPALLIIPDGSRAEIEASIKRQLDVGWPLLIQYADPMDAEPQAADL